jgi:hypothetical protein
MWLIGMTRYPYKSWNQSSLVGVFGCQVFDPALNAPNFALKNQPSLCYISQQQPCDCVLSENHSGCHTEVPPQEP